jgi:hypothetical protein
MIGPVDHIGGGIAHPVEHVKTDGIVFVMAGIQVYRVVMHHRGRIGGIIRLYYRIVRETGRDKKKNNRQG